LWRGGLSYRRLWLLIKHLPPESWTQTALRDSDLDDLDELVAPEPEDRFGPWSHADYLLAGLRDEVARLTYVTARVNGQDKWPEPEPHPRPGVRRKPPAPRGMSEADFIFLNSLRAPRG
jgi:hypothetical protein